MSRTVPAGEHQAAIENSAADREVGHRPGGADRDAPPARLEPRLGGVHERVREDQTSLNPACATRRPNEAIVSPCAVSCTATTAKRPARNTSAAEADLLGDDERRAVAARDQVAEHAEPGTTSSAISAQRRAREQHPAAARGTGARRVAPTPVDAFSRGVKQRRRSPSAPRPVRVGPSTPASKPRSPRSASSARAAPSPSTRSAARPRRSGRAACACRRAARTAARRCRDSRRKRAALEVLEHPAPAPSSASSRLSA